MKSINMKSEELKNSLYNLINNSDLPISNVYFIFQLITQELESTYYQILNEEENRIINNDNQNTKIIEEEKME